MGTVQLLKTLHLRAQVLVDLPGPLQCRGSAFALPGVGDQSKAGLSTWLTLGEAFWSPLLFLVSSQWGVPGANPSS